MDIKLIVFDVDGTIAEPNSPVDRKVSEKLQCFERRGIRIAFASGKNASYLSGLARGIGLADPIIIGENGCIIFYLFVCEGVPSISKNYVIIPPVKNAV